MLSSVCGIKPADVGFNTVKITPHLGNLKQVKADMPHPKGRISVEYQKTGGKLNTTIILPKGMAGTFEYHNIQADLKEGLNKIN
jgi:hypothetical protein